MTQMSVGDFKTNFSEVLELIKKGEEIEVLYGRSKKPIAILSPPKRMQKSELLGALSGKASFSMSDDWKMSPEELLKL